ncbi:Syntaxin-10 [Coemansia sp. RSA 1813]|nr:Syntaxin-10 [Coemansia sp. RSA 1646]KAJ1768611.1 Syntaxin-10 [Coemansia sp. RSA 1843]KAJ2089480.1 Syntaxin-10 [Coemansia sp. RSA 986]KAJ2214550.1 Syntaxin-10 [Coemansia sp. RSA 487]KAJ2569433.1 Syntaxin-10 [Coemansia sp. RSA 1813]
MTDPFDIVQEDVIGSFEQTRTLFASWKQLNGRKRSPQEENEFQFMTDELYSSITSIGNDLDDLQETIDVSRNAPDEYGLTSAEIKERQEFVSSKKRAVSDMRKSLAQPSKSAKGLASGGNSARNEEEQVGYTGGAGLGSQQQQQYEMLMEEQDQHFDSMLGTVRNLHGIASTMNTELDTQAVLLDEVNGLVDRTQSRLASAKKKVDKFLRDKNNRSLHIVLILFVVILVLIMLIIFT